MRFRCILKWFQTPFIILIFASYPFSEKFCDAKQHCGIAAKIYLHVSGWSIQNTRTPNPHSTFHIYTYIRDHCIAHLLIYFNSFFLAYFYFYYFFSVLLSSISCAFAKHPTPTVVCSVRVRKGKRVCVHGRWCERVREKGREQRLIFDLT